MCDGRMPIFRPAFAGRPREDRGLASHVFAIEDLRQKKSWSEMGKRLGCLVLSGCVLLLSGCVASQQKLAWRIRDLAVTPAPTIDLVGHNQVVATVDRLAMQKFLLAHFRIVRTASVQAELLVVEGSDRNAFAALVNNMPTIAVNLGMLKVIQDDVDEFASLLGHEAAHLARNHGGAARSRSSTLQGSATLVGLGLGTAGVPAGGAIAGLAADLIDTSYSRDEEREADTLGIGYADAAGYDPYGAIRLQEKLLDISGPALLPFLSSHPSGRERVENLKAAIEAMRSKQESHR